MDSSVVLYQSSVLRWCSTEELYSQCSFKEGRLASSIWQNVKQWSQCPLLFLSYGQYYDNILFCQSLRSQWTLSTILKLVHLWLAVKAWAKFNKIPWHWQFWHREIVFLRTGKTSKKQNASSHSWHWCGRIKDSFYFTCLNKNHLKSKCTNCLMRARYLKKK